MALRAVLALGVGAVGLYAGGQTPEGVRSFARIVGGVIGILGGVYLGKQAEEKRASAAAVELSNLFVNADNPLYVSPQQVQVIIDKYGLDLRSQLTSERKKLYDQFLSNCIPPGDDPLQGNEAALIKNFKELLQLTDEDAAPVHIEVGRRLSRQRLELGTNKDVAMEERRAFQKLVYISYLVFGEQKSAFLLPWVRIFNMSPSTVEFAVRDNARQLFRSAIQQTGGKLLADYDYLQKLRQRQQELYLNDEHCAEIVREVAQERMVEWLDIACECVKRRGRTKDYTDAMNVIHSLLQYNRDLKQLQDQQEALPETDRTLVPGLGIIAIYGSKYETQPGLSNDLRDVFKVYVEESLRRQGVFTDQLETDVDELVVALALSRKDADRAIREIKSKVYRGMLRQAFASGRLDAAPQKDVILNELVQKLQFDGPTAMDLHLSLYRQKLESILENKKIDDTQEGELDRLRRLLCIRQQDWQAANNEVTGRILQEVLQNAMDAGIDRFGFEDKDNVKSCIEDTRIDRKHAKTVLKEVAQKELLKFMAQSRMKKDRLSQAKELKKMVFFSNIVLTPLLQVINEGMEEESEEDKEKAMKEFAEIMKEAAKEAQIEKQKEEEEGEATVTSQQEGEVAGESKESAKEEQDDDEKKVDEEQKETTIPSTLAKAEQAAAERKEGETVAAEDGKQVEMKSQKEITLADQLSLRDREDTYKLYLMYAMSGDVISMPMGGQIVVERDQGEFARLSQLGDILGLNQLEIYQIHQGLAEQAFKAQVEGISGGSSVLGKQKREKVEEIRKQMGLAEEAANKVIKGILNKKLIGNLEAAKAQGALTYQKILDLKDEGMEIESLVSQEVRLQLFKQEMENFFTSGKGNFAREQLFDEIATNLAVIPDKARQAVEDYAKDKRRPVFVQAAAFLRQRNFDEAVKSLNNYLNISKALDAHNAPEWDREELLDMYGVYCMKVSDEEQRRKMQQTLGLKDEDASSIHEMVGSGAFKFDQEQKEEAFF